MLFTRDSLEIQRTNRLKVKGRKKIFHANSNQKRTGMAIIISDKIDIKLKKITRDKEGYYVLIKGSIQQGDITIIKMYAPNDRIYIYIYICGKNG